MRILAVEDDLRMLELLRKGLWEAGHTVMTAPDGDTGLELALNHEFDAIVLDIGLPERSGYNIMQHLLQRPARPAIVMLTALNQEDNIVYGLDSGADDYITKPFSFPELIARLASAVRRTQIIAADHFNFGPFKLDISKRRLFRDLAEVHITRSEYLLLRALALHRGEVVSRRKLTQAVWGSSVVSHGSLDTLMNTLREKIDNEQLGLIATVRGSGYTLIENLDPRLRASQ
jgi:two-component system copper resistance phosphate regulon response regulator CusR